jgi:hypothetical protein
MNGDVLSIIEAAYAESADADAWLDGALAAMHAQLDQGGGVLARRFQVQPASIWQGDTRAIGVAPEDVAATDRAAAWLTELPPPEAMAVARQMFPLAPVAVRLSHLIGRPMMTHLVTNYSSPRIRAATAAFSSASRTSPAPSLAEKPPFGSASRLTW